MNKTFNYRHDFDAQDLKVLKNNFPEIIFKDIPEAWICKIDSMLLSFKNIENIKEVKQSCGFLFVKGKKELDLHDKNLIETSEKDIYQADSDLYQSTKLLN